MPRRVRSRRIIKMDKMKLFRFRQELAIDLGRISVINFSTPGSGFDINILTVDNQQVNKLSCIFEHCRFFAKKHTIFVLSRQ